MLSADPPATRVLRAGIDTWSLGWYTEPDSELACALAKVALNAGPRGSMMVAEKIDGHTVGWFPGTLLVFAEGHPDAAGGLAPVRALRAAQDRLERSIRAAGLPLPVGVSKWAQVEPGSKPQRLAGRAGLRRLDSTVDVLFSDPKLGLTALDALVGVDHPRSRPGAIWSQGGAVETIYLYGYASRRVLGRIYDKGNESGEHTRGTLIRLEDQRRFQSGKRPTVESVTPATVHQLFSTRLGGITAAPTFLAGDARVLADRLQALVDEGKMRPTTAEKLAGSLILRGSSAGSRSKRTEYRRRARLRELGLHFTAVAGPGIEVEISRLFAAAMGADVWDQVQAQAAELRVSDR